jgi:glycosyltransferase A (GT-A) superfamily protein (DUF2064 family)
MTVVAVLADPPWPGLVLPRVVEQTPLSATDAADLYEAALADAVRAVATSGGDLLVNYRPADLLPADVDGADDPETAVRAVAEDALTGLEGDPHVEAARYEPQVGETEAARVGNTVTHLLREEGADSAAVLRPTAPLVGRTEIDAAAMKLRNAASVLGPTETGGVYYAGFAEPVEFTDALAPAAVETLTARTDDAGGQADFIGMSPTITTASGLATTVALVRARGRAGRRTPVYTAAAVEALGLAAERTESGTPTVRVDGTD